MTEETNSFKYSRWLASPEPGEEVVISGMSGRLPESDNVEEFKNNIFAKKNLCTLNKDKWNIDHPELPKRSAKIPNIDKFDAGFFGIHYRLAKLMDPMMIKFMEVVTETIMDSGTNPVELEGTKTGVFVGASWSDMENETLMGIKVPQQYALLGYLRSLIAHRVSYHLKLKGPAFVSDTACSSSMTALAAAFRAIRNGQCENAIVGGTQLLLHPGNSIQFYRMGVLSKEGIGKTFDQNADGYVRAESIACIFLQKAKNSRRIYAKIINVKANVDGFKDQSITFPSTYMQQELLKEIYSESNIDPNDLSYLEAHGTGTIVGDVEEVQAIDEILAKKRAKPLFIGSVKSTAGHAEPASLFASLFKTLIAFETGIIAPTINLTTVKNGLIGVIEGRISIVKELTELEGNEAIVGINNFGFGGTNVHTILKRFNKKKINRSLSQNSIPRLVCVSGRTKDSVLRIIEEINNKKLDNEYIGLLHHIYKYDIKGHIFRGFAIISEQKLIKTCVKEYHRQKPFILIFGDTQKTYKVLGKSLIKMPVFKNTLSRINKILTEKGLKTIDDNFEEYNGYYKNNFASLCVQFALVDFLKLLEIKPTVVYGDPAGKIATDYFTNAISLDTAVLSALNKQNFNSDNFEHKKNDNILGHKTPENSFIINISDSHINSGRNSVEVLLQFLGRLYQEGYNLPLHKIYSDVEYPVSRNTPMISPLIQWYHEKSWPVYKFSEVKASNVLQRKFTLGITLEEFKYCSGHIIDGRQLFPATGFLYLVWQTYAEMRNFKVDDFPVTFSNCKFIKAVLIPQNNFVTVTVTIQKGTGLFEILDKDSVIVSGHIQTSAVMRLPNEQFIFDEDQTKILEEDEIYRELYLRGYNYRDIFKGIQKCSSDVSKAIVKWQNNWPGFLDNLLQLAILQIDTRLLYVPVSIKKLAIDPKIHLNFIENSEEESFYPTHFYKNCNIIKSGGVEIDGLTARSIAKRKQELNPVLERHEFIPYQSTLKLSEAVRVNVQIILENTLDNQFKAVEIIDENSNEDLNALMYFVSKTLDDIPLITSDLIISTTKPMEEVPGVQIKNVLLNPENNLDLIIANRVLQNPSVLTKLLESLNVQGFLLTREDTDFVYQDFPNLDLITEYKTPNEKLVLIRKQPQVEDTKIIKVSSENFQWLTQLKEFLTNNFSVTIYCENQTQEGILGLINCIRREPRGGKVNCFFMMDKSPKFDTQDGFYKQQFRKRLAVNVFKNNSWGTYRHLLLEEVPQLKCEHSYVNIMTRGDLSTFRWLEGPLSLNTPISNKENLISVYYAGINFKDVMAASGRVSIEAFTMDRFLQDCLLGFEMSGRDSSGRRVCGFVMTKAISSLVVTDSNFLFEIPDAWSMEDAATVPVIYATVIYSLLMKGEMKPGNSVLIHSATGGVGLAAINVCLYYKCKIFVTVGSQEKRDYLKKYYPQIPDSHIGNSHDTSFEKMIKTQTNKQGVDYVLNSLSEEKLEASIRCLAQGGCFLELGKYDLFNDTSLQLLLLEKNASYHGIMFDKGELFSEVFDAVKVGIKKGYVKPIPRKVFESEEVEKTFKYMTTGKHIGKVLIKIRNEEKEKTVTPSKTLFCAYPRFNCNSQHTYVIVGGLGGVGLELADWLVQRGAKKLVLSSRSGIQNGYQNYRIRYWKSYNVNVTISTEDITTKQGCLNLLKTAAIMGPVDAIFNLAVVLKDALLEDQTEESFRTSLLPKAQATIYLDELTRELCPHLRYFVVFSSVSCGRGNAGQTNYGMANSIMERICENRKRDKLPAVAIQWGAIGDVGLVAKMQSENKELIIGGTLQQKISSCLEVLDKLLKQDHPVVSSMVVAKKHGTNYGELNVVEAVALVLGIEDIKTVSQHATLAELGMDSIMATEVVQVLEKDFDIFMTVKEVRSLSLAKLFEIESDRKSSVNDKSKKIHRGANTLIQFIPDNSEENVSTIKLPSLADKSKNTKTVFVLPGIEGVFKPFEFLSKQMKAEVIGLQYPNQNRTNSIEELAKDLITSIEAKLSKTSNFVIIGYSFGALVAFEIVSILESKGYNGKVILIDGSPAYLASATKELFPTENDMELQTAILLRILTILLPVDLTMQQKENLLKCKTFEERIDLCFSLVPSEIVAMYNFEKKTPVTLYKRIQSLLMYKFNHDKIKSKTYLFKAKHSITSDQRDYELANLCEKEVNVATIEADHATILNQQELAESVKKIILQ